MVQKNENSAIQTLSLSQKVFLLFLLLLSAALLFGNYFGYLLAVMGSAVVIYTLVTLFKFYILIRPQQKHFSGLQFSIDEVQQLSDDELPTYTILVPLYREENVVEELIEHLDKLSYPKEKLQILLLLEEDDRETIETVNALSLPAHLRPVLVPEAYPKTKPKACNYGLSLATGEYLVIYDAEDRPDEDQLKKAFLAFEQVKRQGKQNVACIQAKLNFYNPRQNWLTKLFTLEYSFWFDLLLPGLVVISAPTPLGGTSNHFVTAVLKELSGWDAYNVTEDCDMGVRLKRAGYEVEMIDSVTWEEANGILSSWIRQRSHWVKGYFQTYFVHTRRPLKLLKELGVWNSIHFHVVVGAMPILSVLNPIFWGLFWVHLFTGSTFIESLFPGIILYLGAFCLFCGNFAFLYLFLCAALKRGDYDLVKWAFLSPICWFLMSIAAWKALIQLIHSPHYWEKTRHGFSKDNRTAKI